MNENTEKKYPSSDDLFDLDKIPMEVLDKGHQSYRPYLKNFNFPKENSTDDLLTAEELGNYMRDELKRLSND